MKALRWPALITIPLLIGVMLVVDRSHEVDSPEPQATTGVDEELAEGVVQPIPLVTPTDDGVSRWYCVGGTGGGNDMIDAAAIAILNTSDETRVGTVTAFNPDGVVAEEGVELSPLSRLDLDLADLTDVGNVATLLEFDGGGVAAASIVSGPHGMDVAPCSSEPSPSWYLPSAATTLDARAVLLLFNPFPDDAVLEISFLTADGVRQPPGFEGQVVPASSMIAIDVTEVVTVRKQFSTQITSTRGRVVAAMMQSYDGSEELEGLSLSPGAPRPSETWFFPSGLTGEGRRETYVVMNPNDVEAQVDVTVALDDPEENGAVPPVELTVPRRGFAVIGSGDDAWGRVPDGVGHSVSVRSRNGVGVVASELVARGGDDPGPGFASAVGSPIGATEWVVPVIDMPDASGVVASLNPSPLTRSRVTGVGVGAGELEELAVAELAEGGRVVTRFDEEVGATPAGALIRSETPTVVSVAFGGGDLDRAWFVAIPVEGTTEWIDPTGG